MEVVSMVPGITFIISDIKRVGGDSICAGGKVIQV